MPHFYLPIAEQLTILEQYIQQATSSIKDKPPGVLNIQINHSRPQYYYKTQKSDVRGTYISKERIRFISELAQKDYEERFLHIANQQKKKLLNLQSQNLRQSASEMYHALSGSFEKLSEERKALVTPYVLPDPQYVASWLSISY